MNTQKESPDLRVGDMVDTSDGKWGIVVEVRAYENTLTHEVHHAAMVHFFMPYGFKVYPVNALTVTGHKDVICLVTE